ncbi:MAG: sigma-70 family RNA polymerase sigma factor [Christensenellales bacterium]|jgi:RNA polymerase primary sigma factor
MANASRQQRIVTNLLYARYQANGFITEDEALDLMTEHNLPLSEIDRVTEQLLIMGVLIRDESDDLDDPDDGYDRTRTDYDEIFSRTIEIDPGLASFIETVKTIQAPQHREWINLLPQAKAGNEYAYNRIFQMYLRNVVKIALWHHDKNDTPLADAIQDGCIGLMTAIEKYEYGKQDLFTTYAPWWIQQVISRNYMDTARTIRIPVHMFETIRKISRTSAQLLRELGRKPSFEELAFDLDESAEKVSEILALTQECISLEDFDEDELSDYGLFAYEMFENISHDALRSTVGDLLERLTPRESEVLVFRFGLNSDEPMTLEEIGQIFNVTRERIRQIEAKAIRKLCHPSRSRKLKDYYLD